MNSASPQIGRNSKIAATALIDNDVIIGDDCEIADFVIIRSGTSIGNNCKIFPHAVIGEEPQDRSYQGEKSFVQIGDNNIIREFCSIHKATGEAKSTIIGDNNYLMAYAHVGHNCQIGSNVTIANSAQLAGHVEIHDYATIGGIVALHQFVRVGKYAMVSGMAASNKDIPPYMMAAGTPAVAININRHALRKAGFSAEACNGIYEAFKLIYRGAKPLPVIVESLKTKITASPELNVLIRFLEESKRGIKLNTSSYRSLS